MSFTHSNEDYENSYKRKLTSATKRGIEMTITQQEYIALLKARPTLVCGYTNQAFIMNKGSENKMYPEMDRIDPNKGYVRGNIIFCARKVHKLKTVYIENEQGRKGIGHGNICILRSIDKILSMDTALQQRLQPYEDIFNKVNERTKEVEAKCAKQLEREAAIQAAAFKEETKAKFKQQQHFAKYYAEKFEDFDKIDQVMEISIREMRDLLRITKDAITKEPFDGIWDKHLWVVDKTQPITKDNVKIVLKTTQQSLDLLSKGDSMVLMTAMKNLNKIL